MILTSVLITPSLVYSQEEAGNSAMLKHPLISAPALEIEAASPSYEIKRKTIKAVLQKYNSPLKDEDINEFISQCKELEMNCYFMPSIWGVESQFCNAIASGTNNCNGWGGGYLTFPTFKDNIKVTALSLKKNYIGRGASTVEGVGRIYASSGTWSAKVRHFLAVFEAEEKNQELISSVNAVK